MSSRTEILRRKNEKAASLRAERAAAEGSRSHPSSEREIIDTTLEGGATEVPVTSTSQKRTRVSEEDVVRTYLPEWSVLDSDRFAARASTEAKDVAPISAVLSFFLLIGLSTRVWVPSRPAPNFWVI